MKRVEDALVSLWQRVKKLSPKPPPVRMEIPEWGYVLGQDYKSYKQQPSEGELSILNKAGAPQLLDTLRGDSITQSRVGFILTGLVGHSSFYWMDSSVGIERVKYAVDLIASGGVKSAEAIAVAAASYIHSGGVIGDVRLLSDTAIMARAIEADPIRAQETPDLGLSQAFRLNYFRDPLDQSRPYEKRIQTPFSRRGLMRNFQNQRPQRLERWDPALEEWERINQLEPNLPTIGGEFHFAPDFRDGNVPPIFVQNTTLLRRLAILNMSQYQRGSSIPFSRMDGRVPEVRMNPSTFPVASAIWGMMTILVPELNRNYFNISVGDRSGMYLREVDMDLAKRMHSLGSLLYAANYKTVPATENRGGVYFGDYWFSQTVQINAGKFKLGGDYDKRGQLNFFLGYGRMFEELSLYLSMVAVEPRLLDGIGGLNQSTSPKSAVELNEHDIEGKIIRINDFIRNDPKLLQLTERGDTLTALLKA